jgi:SAM-dependent methyltransferase
MRPWLRVPCDWRRPGAPIPEGGWRLWWSDGGDYGCLHPLPSAPEVAQFYDLASYYTHDTDRHGAGARRLPERVRVGLGARIDRGVQPDARFWASVVPPRARTGIEIGTGNGDRMVELAALLPSIEGLEPDLRARETAAAKGLTVHPGTAEDLPPELAGRRFDFVLFAHVLEHCRDPALALANARGLIADSGVMVLETPNNAATALRMAGAHWLWLDVPRHLHFFTESSLRAFAERAGFRVERVEYWGYVRQLLTDWIAAEAAIAGLFSGRPARAAEPEARRRAWALLALGALAPASRKYDSVRLICRPA